MKVFFRNEDTGQYENETPFLTKDALQKMYARVSEDTKNKPDVKILTFLETDPTAQSVGLPLFVIDINEEHDEQSIKLFLEAEIPKLH